MTPVPTMVWMSRGLEAALGPPGLTAGGRRGWRTLYCVNSGGCSPGGSFPSGPSRPPRPRPGLGVRGQTMPVLRPWAPRRTLWAGRLEEGEPLLEEGAGPEALGTLGGGRPPEGFPGTNARWEHSGGPAGVARGGEAVGPLCADRPRPRPPWGGRPKVLATAPSAALQLGLRRASPPEGGGEEAVAPLPVAGPRAEDLPGAAAAPAPEARERHRAAGRLHSSHVHRGLQRSVPGDHADGRRPQQHRQVPGAERRARAVPRVPVAARTEVHPLGRDHPPGPEAQQPGGERGLRAQDPGLRAGTPGGRGDDGLRGHALVPGP